ncbi:hypothetical protein BO94DRAFT_64160 [Aspergillus sclerotioniger CBS 115572]|uniref:Uncharacterized protein n=1 Tax=Aspergillus sclerotioniger CBS 115572 TaxID=1450535 RepID=A0A317WT28_9EURO|nr:hypothetical protein BO94DRAFT_64160 [Aspergillus sclerotioniger CBS 115572]PWY88078.1 hypothetical protein BO94DRAFT_64160 [Aspergillus sclerotioniger CBS 115572]
MKRRGENDEVSTGPGPSSQATCQPAVRVRDLAVGCIAASSSIHPSMLAVSFCGLEIFPFVSFSFLIARSFLAFDRPWLAPWLTSFSSFVSTILLSTPLLFPFLLTPSVCRSVSLWLTPLSYTYPYY